MENLKSEMKAIENLMGRIVYVRQQLEAWQQPPKNEQTEYSLELRGVSRRTHAPFTENPFGATDRDSDKRIHHHRPELQAATLAARDLVIQALQTELARLEAELSTYTITKQ